MGKRRAQRGQYSASSRETAVVMDGAALSLPLQLHRGRSEEGWWNAAWKAGWNDVGVEDASATTQAMRQWYIHVHAWSQWQCVTQTTPRLAPSKLPSSNFIMGVLPHLRRATHDFQLRIRRVETRPCAPSCLEWPVLAGRIPFAISLTALQETRACEGDTGVVRTDPALGI